MKLLFWRKWKWATEEKRLPGNISASAQESSEDGQQGGKKPEAENAEPQLYSDITIVCKERRIALTVKGDAGTCPTWCKFKKWLFAQPYKSYFVFAHKGGEYLVSRKEIKWYEVEKVMR